MVPSRYTFFVPEGRNQSLLILINPRRRTEANVVHDESAWMHMQDPPTRGPPINQGAQTAVLGGKLVYRPFKIHSHIPVLIVPRL